ncbi:MAG: glycosyltransferase [Nitrospirae bacterium]|nr:glycosyltransferase [Nitrospirota bacterium]
MLVQFLYFSLTGMVLSGSLMLLLGHRVRRGHWLISLGYLSTIAYSSHLLLGSIGTLSTNAYSYLVLVLLIGTPIIALTEHWNALGQATFTMALMSALSFLAYADYVTFSSHLGPLSLFFSVILLILEILALLLMMVHTFEVVDVICRIRWRRSFTPQPTTRYFPKVSLHVPAYNEPPEMVIQTLDALAKLDYPDYEVIVIDDNTMDEKLWRPVEAHCHRLGFKFFHLENWPGFKSGALNYALRQTDPQAELVGVVDSDYVVEPDYLKDLAGFFEDPKMAFVQTPQDYRDCDPQDRYAVACYHAYQYFFKVSMASRNERNGIIFAGTMGLIRRKVLEEMGGWDEWCITEDAEISVRILSEGYQSVFIDRTYGRGLMPLNFEGLRKQRFRWAFGGMQILRLHWPKLLPGSGILNPTNRLTLGQKFDYLLGGLQWLNDPVALAFTVILLISTVSLSLTQSVFLQPMAGAALFVPFIFIVFGLTKFLWALRIRVGCTPREAYRSFLILLSLTWVVTLACLLGLTKKEGVFLRTPKQRGQPALIRSIQVVGKEILLAGVCLASAVWLLAKEPINGTILLLLGLLTWQAFIYGSALVANHWSHRSEMLATNPVLFQTSRTTGERFRAMVTDRRATLSLAGAAALAASLFYLAVINAPEIEQVYRTNPLRSSLIPHSLINNPPEVHIKAKIYLEERAALAQDVEAAMSLWDPEGIIRDANYTPEDERDDRIWSGIDGIRSRYEKEFHLRSYIDLTHQSLSTVIEEDTATVVNDLNATLRTDGKIQKVYLSRGDRWTFRKENGEWKITSLTVNRTPR